MIKAEKGSLLKVWQSKFFLSKSVFAVLPPSDRPVVFIVFESMVWMCFYKCSNWHQPGEGTHKYCLMQLSASKTGDLMSVISIFLSKFTSHKREYHNTKMKTWGTFSSTHRTTESTKDIREPLHLSIHISVWIFFYSEKLSDKICPWQRLQDSTSFYWGSEKRFTALLEQLASEPKVQEFPE